jgi:hypothetical protein
MFSLATIDWRRRMKEGLIIIYRAACKKPDSGFFV